MKKNLLFVLSGIVFTFLLSACDDKNSNDLDENLAFSKLSVEEQKQKIEQNGIPDVVFTTGYANCVEAFRMGSRGDIPIYGYVIYKPDGGQIIVSGTTRITRTKVKNNNEL